MEVYSSTTIISLKWKKAITGEQISALVNQVFTLGYYSTAMEITIDFDLKFWLHKALASGPARTCTHHTVEHKHTPAERLLFGIGFASLKANFIINHFSYK